MFAKTVRYPLSKKKKKVKLPSLPGQCALWARKKTQQTS